MNDEQISALKEWAMVQDIKEPIHVEKHMYISNPNRFIKVQLEILNNNKPKNRIFMASFRRLSQLKKHLDSVQS